MPLYPIFDKEGNIIGVGNASNVKPFSENDEETIDSEEESNEDESLA